MILETFGSIIKEEQLQTVTQGIIPHTLVLENKDPFPGYYGAEPSDKVPDSFFLAMTQKESTEKILRLAHIVRRNSNIIFEGSPGCVCIYNDTYQVIRIRGLSDFSRLHEIQHYFRDSGIHFMKSKKIEAPGIIHIKKIFRVEALDDTMLKDSDRDMYYLKIEKQLTWSHFRSVTAQVKNNLPNASFDAALAIIYGSEVLDLVRIYSKNISIDYLREVHHKYNEIISRGIYGQKLPA
ncbi:MAG: hypothetical protein JXB34_05555 [Bacteroidales bacterium]|nr:hypothetical protein [Bacteroidales bacterium]